MVPSKVVALVSKPPPNVLDSVVHRLQVHSDEAPDETDRMDAGEDCEGAS